MKWIQHKSLSEADMEFLVGSTLMEKIQRNRLIIKYEHSDTKASYEDLGLYSCEGLYYFRQLGGREDTPEILFELESDLHQVEQNLTQFKLGNDN